MKIKASLHNHSHEDPLDFKIVDYSAYDLIDRATKAKIRVLAITNHKQCLFSEKLRAYAKKQGILLISGIELKIEGNKDILVLGADKTAEKINTIKKLRSYRQKMGNKILVIAPHPFHPDFNSAGKILVQHPDLFDAIEQSWFLDQYGANKLAKIASKKLKLPLVSTPDTHFIEYFESGWIVIEHSQANISQSQLFSKIRAGKFSNFTKKYSFWTYIWVYIRMITKKTLDSRFTI